MSIRLPARKRSQRGIRNCSTPLLAMMSLRKMWLWTFLKKERTIKRRRQKEEEEEGGQVDQASCASTAMVITVASPGSRLEILLGKSLLLRQQQRRQQRHLLSPTSGVVVTALSTIKLGDALQEMRWRKSLHHSSSSAPRIWNQLLRCGMMDIVRKFLSSPQLR